MAFRRAIASLGHLLRFHLAAFGDFWRFAGQTCRFFGPAGWKMRSLRNLMEQMYEVGVKSVPVVGVTGAFVGMALAVETYSQFKAIGMEKRLGVVINLSVVKEIGPVLAAMMLAGRIGGALTAELGTMNVTEQLDALRVMGADPIGVLVMPRFLACIILTPVLTLYSDMLGVLGGYFIGVKSLGIPPGPYWQYSRQGVELWELNEGILKAILFGAVIGIISCYKGFTTRAGASGVGRACTESFVASFVAIIVVDFFFAHMAKDWYEALYGIRGILG
jgi:phospholipid/cholesterol/gamma-HCH transport system permease protein